jgi:xylulose-5-phosphate/fructose-6-phosphate phosphoketolase
MTDALSPDLLSRMNAYWRAANYLSVGQIYLRDNPLLEVPLTIDHVKPRLLGHWGTTTGLNFIYVHLNRLITQNDLDMIYIIGPGHGGPGLVAHTYLEGSYTELYPAIGRNRNGMHRLFRQFSWPGGIPSHVAPETPGSIHEGGELGYSLAHAYGAAFDNPDLIVACVVGDGEAETGPLATSWHSNKFLNPARDGAVLPILHLNGFKIANPTVLARISREELTDLLRGYGHEPFFVEGDDPALVHQQLAATLDTVLEKIRAIQAAARTSGHVGDAAVPRPRWPMIVFRTPKGWTGPKEVDGKPVEGTWRAHQVPIASFDNPEHLTQLEAWMRSYKPEELFDADGKLIDDLAALAPTGHRRMGSNPHANGGMREPLAMPHFRDHGVPVDAPGSVKGEATRVLGGFLREVMRLSLSDANFRLFGPDETASNRLEAVYDVSGKVWMADIEPVDEHLSSSGRVMEVLSEHLCQGWLEGYLLTGRHGFFSCYEAFIHIVDSMVNQHAKWLKVSAKIPWRQPIASLNYLLTSHVWRQDHNGLSHQDPGFIDHIANKKADVARIYLPPDANCLLSVADHCLRSRGYINLIVAGKQPEWQWLNINDAVVHCAAGASIWEWASDEGEPDIVMACAGDVPTVEALAAVMLLHEYVPDIRVRFVNVVDLMVLEPQSEHPHGLPDSDFDALFTTDKPVIFAFHGYPAMIHKLTYRRRNHANIHVRGYKEEGTTTTPFDMVVLNNLDRYQLALDAIKRIPRLQHRVEGETARYWTTMERHKLYVAEHGDDMPEVRDWHWAR